MARSPLPKNLTFAVRLHVARIARCEGAYQHIDGNPLQASHRGRRRRSSARRCDRRSLVLAPTCRAASCGARVRMSFVVRPRPNGSAHRGSTSCQFDSMRRRRLAAISSALRLFGSSALRHSTTMPAKVAVSSGSPRRRAPPSS
jgi:hypothetical protein